MRAFLPAATCGRFPWSDFCRPRCLDDAAGRIDPLDEFFQRHLLRRRQALIARGRLDTLTLADRFASSEPISREFRAKRAHVPSLLFRQPFVSYDACLSLSNRCANNFALKTINSLEKYDGAKTANGWHFLPFCLEICRILTTQVRQKSITIWFN